MPQSDFKETWTVTQPPVGFDRPSWERTGPTITREVEGVGYQPAIGGYGGVQHIDRPVVGYGGGSSLQGYLARSRARHEALRAEIHKRGQADLEALNARLAAERASPEFILKEKIRLKKLELELADLGGTPAETVVANYRAVHPEAYQALPFPWGPLLAVLLFAGLVLMIVKLKAPVLPSGQPAPRTSRPSDPLDGDLSVGSPGGD